MKLDRFTEKAIQRLVQDPLARVPLEGKFSEADTIEVDVAGNELRFTKGKVAAAVS